MSELKHRPTPWHYQEGADAYTHIIRADCEPNLIVCSFSQDSTGKSEANARFTVRAVNSYDAMVEALELADEATSQIVGPTEWPRKEIRAALALARGGK